MKYNIIGENKYNSEDVILEILKNRNVKEDIFDYSKESLPDPFVFTNMDNAVKCISGHIERKSNIVIVSDSDPDGLTSASIIHNYIKDHDEDANIFITIHEKRVHGIFESELNDLNIDLLIVPDAGSDNANVVRRLENELGIDIVIIDHHHVGIEEMVKHGILVNNAIDKIYTDLSGAGMVYMLCKALDEEMWSDYADKYIDLAMLGCVSDMMNISSDYMQYIVQEGMNKIKNPALRAIVDAQSFSIGENINPTAISFYVTPLINSVYRLGDMELKRDLVNAFCLLDNNTYIYEPKRGKNKGIQIEETINEKVARACNSINGKRKRLGDKAKKEAVLHEDCVINFVEMKQEHGEKGIARLVANGLARSSMKPTIAYYKNSEGKLKGSMSSGDLIENFKDKLIETDVFEYVAGHQGASGFEIKEDMLESATEIFNKRFENYSFEKIHNVDFEIPFDDFVLIGHEIASNISEYENMYGRGFETPKIVIKDIVVPISKVELMGSKKNTIKILLSDNMSAIMFNKDQDFYSELVDWKENCCVDILGKFSKNEYNDRIYYQIIVEDIKSNEDCDETSDFKEDGLDEWEW